MRRSYHVLTSNEANTRPQYMIFVNTETGIERVDKKTTEYPFKLGVAHYWRRRRDGGKDAHEWFEFTDRWAFWHWVERHTFKNSVTYLVANKLLPKLASLDFLNVLARQGWKCTFAFDSDHTSLYKFRRDGKTLYCVDNRNLFRGKLADWANAVGMPRVEIDLLTASGPELRKRCRQDVKIMLECWRWWLDFLDEHDLGIFKPTIAAQAFQAYRHRFMPYKIKIHNFEEATALERESYRGGRAEPFRIGHFEDGPFCKLDTNSMYPHVMRKFDYPTNFTQWGSSLAVSTLALFLNKYGVIAEVYLNVDEPWFPVSRRGRNVYPIGRFRTVLTTEELGLALIRGWIEEVGQYARYTMKPIFREFVDYLYPLKAQYAKEGNEVLRTLVKDLLNSLHGKFGQRCLQTRKLGTCDPSQNEIVYAINAQTHKHSTIRFMGGQVKEESRGGTAYNAFPAIAAHVSANARLELYKLVKEAGHANVLYCDTDSLIVSSIGHARLLHHISDTELGGLKIEGVANEITIRAPKDYAIGSRNVVKGIPVDARWLDENSAEVELWPGLTTYLASGADPTYRTKTIVRTLSRRINHGWVGEDGWLRPFEYPEDALR